MEKQFRQYQKLLADLILLASSEEDSQSEIAQEERSMVAQIENEYERAMSEIQRVRQTVVNQYRSVWESCTNNTGLKRPEEQRPAYTDKGWRDCVREQELAAKAIRDWFAKMKQQAVAERKRQVQQKAEREAAEALIVAETERRRREETAALEKAKGAALLEEMKRKYRKQ